MTGADKNGTQKKKRLGILGGMGPMATASFYKILIESSYAEKDSDHPDVILTGLASTPDRTDFLLGKSGSSPLPLLLEAAHLLTLSGADVIAMPCNTAHAFYDEIVASVSVPVLNMIKITADYAYASGGRRFGLLATEGTVRVGLYQNFFAASGLSVLVPSEKTQSCISSLIYQSVKRGKIPGTEEIASLISDPVFSLCDAVILGCTELSILLPAFSSLFPRVIDPALLLAEKAIVLCGGTLKSKTTEKDVIL